MYFIRFCPHGYSDNDAVKILGNIIPAMKHGAKLVVMDTVLPEPNTVGQSQERLQRYVVLGVDVKQRQANLEQHPRSSDNGFFHEGERKGN